MESQYSRYSKQNRDNAAELNHDIAFCTQIKSTSWRGLSYQLEFKRPTHLNTTKEVAQCNRMATALEQGKAPTALLAKACKAIYDRAIEDKWQF